MKKLPSYSTINKMHIDLMIDRNEVLRYLGYGSKKVDAATSNIIDNCIEELLEIARTSFIYNIYEIKREKDSILLRNSRFKLEGKDIYRHLQASKKCVIMAVTLGYEVDKRIKYYSKIDLTKGFIFDACAAAGVEALCDRVESIIKKIAVDSGYDITSRYSPGYGDLSMEIQPKILSLLDTQKHIGLTVTESCILIPRKSVTALIGMGEKVSNGALSCKDCRLYNNCSFIKEGDSCGNSKTTKK